MDEISGIYQAVNFELSSNSTFQILLENLTTNMMYSLKIQASSESLYSPGKIVFIHYFTHNFCREANDL